MIKRLLSAALALALLTLPASAQTNQGSSPMTIQKGGTNATTASQARTNLGLAIGSNVQAWDADLDALAALSGTSTIYYRSGAATWTAVTIGSFLSFSAGTLNVGDAELTALGGLTSANNKCFYWTGSGTAANFDCSSFGRTLINSADASAGRTNLGVVIGTDVQAYDAELAAIAGLTSAANKVPYFTGSGTAALADFPSTVRTWFTTSSSANLASILTDETGSGPAMFGTAPQVTSLFDVAGAIKFSIQSAPSQITSNQNDYNPSSVNCATSTALLINSDAARDITGLGGGVTGCIMRLINNGSFTITLKEQSASSTAGNRFNSGGDIALAANASVTLLYDGTASRWRMTSPASAGGGGGTVTSAVIAGTNGITTTGTCTITTSGTCTAELTSARRTLPTTQSFTSGSGTYTTPANVLWIEVYMTGGGGGGGGGGTGGGGAGGTGGNTCWNTSGAACTSPVYQASGGGGGSPSGGGDAGAGGGVGGSGTCTRSGTGNGGTGPGNSAASTYPVGQAGGGSAFLGGAGRAVFGAGVAGATNTGGGGSGAGQFTASSYAGSGGGGGGGCYVIIGSPASTYTYAVGAAGSAGSAGTSGNAGGAGGSGIITVIEHYGT